MDHQLNRIVQRVPRVLYAIPCTCSAASLLTVAPPVSIIVACPKRRGLFGALTFSEVHCDRRYVCKRKFPIRNPDGKFWDQVNSD